MDESIKSHAGLHEEILQSWHIANRPLLHKIGERLDDAVSFPAHLIPCTGNEDQDTVPFISALEMAEVFAMSWQRAELGSPFFFMAYSDPYVTLVNHHVLRSVYQANAHALERVLAWLTIWLEARGLTVDRKAQLVELAGYEALFYRSTGEM